MPQPSSTMKIRAERIALADALGWVARAVPKNPSTPVLGSVRVSASGGVVTLSAFDYETQHTAAIEATVGDEGQCVVPGLFLRSAITGGRGAEVDLILDGPQLEITSGRSTYRARCFDAANAPTLPPFPSVHGVVDADRLRDAVAMIAPAISDDQPNPNTQGVHVEGDAQTLTLIATDRYRFHAVEIPWNGDGTFEVTIPGRALVEAVKGMNESVEVGVSENMLGLSDGRHQWTTRRFDTPYVEWRRVLSSYTEKCSEAVGVDLSDLLAAVKQVGSATEAERPIILDFTNGELAVRTPEQDQGEGLEVIDTEGTTSLTIATNPRYLADALSVASGPIEIHYGGSYAKSGAFIVADQAHPELTLIVMSKSMPGGTK